jgi:hypothetical protein
MRRVHLRGHQNILKRVLLQAGACNLGLLMRQLVGVGTLRFLQGRGLRLLACLWALWPRPERLWEPVGTLLPPFTSRDQLRALRSDRHTDLTATTTCTTGC